MHQTGSVSSLTQEAELLQLHFQDMLTKWGSNQPSRGGLHASSLLVSENDWCPRRYVLAELFPQEAVTPALNPWDWKRTAIFENGWSLHKRWQRIFKQFARVAYGNTNNDTSETATVSLELDLTHFDEERGVFFSPDAILDFGPDRYVVEIKGINHAAFESLPSSLEGAMKACETVAKAVPQANLYMHLLGLKRAIILIENKNNQDFRLWVTQYDKNLALPYVQRAYQIKGGLVMARTSNKLPMRVCSAPSDPLAKQCPMCKKCFSESLEVNS